MNAVNALFRAEQECDFWDAVGRACKWTAAGRPLILATIRLDGVIDEELYGLVRAERQRDYDEARGYVTEARKSLEGMLEGIRDGFIADERKTNARSEDEAEYFDNFNDALEGEVVAVPNLIKQVEREDYDAFIKGERR